jgi:uncharacterized protein (DUF2336 family)
MTKDRSLPGRSPDRYAPSGPDKLATESEAVRVRLGASRSTSPDILHRLAGDASVTVRVALALNQAAPPGADASLAHDGDERVRALLARKLAMLVPDLAGAEKAALQSHTHEMLGLLVQDAAVKVRAAIAEAVKQMPQAPRGLILRLAQDADLPVSEPVIRFSPLLTSDDLLALLADAPVKALAVARRPGIDTAVSDAVAASADSAVVQALLENQSAQIREATLDALIARAAEQPDWHAPLVRRPELPPRAARALSEIVTTCLLEELAARADLPADLAHDLRARVAARLGAGQAQTRVAADLTLEEALDNARALAAAGQLSEQALLDATSQGKVRLASALLAVAASLPVSVVDRAVRLRSAKGLVSLVWKAGFTMRAAGVLQTVLARLAPEAVLPAGPGGNFPLALEEMRWQLDFLSRAGR